VAVAGALSARLPKRIGCQDAFTACHWTGFGSLPPAIKGLENRFGELERQAAAKPRQ
jgi:hypothetical protein